MYGNEKVRTESNFAETPDVAQSRKLWPDLKALRASFANKLRYQRLGRLTEDLRVEPANLRAK